MFLVHGGIVTVCCTRRCPTNFITARL